MLNNLTYNKKLRDQKKLYSHTILHKTEIVEILKEAIISMRFGHCIKNFFIFLPILFTYNLFNLQIFYNGLIVFFLFTLISGCIYIINDIADAENDRIHPDKWHRPIASGRLSVQNALIISISTMLVSLTISFYMNDSIGLILASYALMNILYSFYLKQIVILDVFIIATGFLLRVFAGCVVSLVTPSPWVILTTFSLSLLLAFGKRRAEICILNEKSTLHRSVLSKYQLQLIDQFITILLGMTILSYSLFAVSEYAASKFETASLIYTVPFVIYGTFRYLYLLYCKNYGGNPVSLVFQDVSLSLSIVLWCIACIVVIYFHI